MALSPEQTQTVEHLAQHEPSRAVIETALLLFDREEGSERIVFTRPFEKLAVSLSRNALTLSILHDHTPLKVADFPDKKLFLYPSISFAVSINEENEDLPPINARIFAADTLNRPVDTQGPEFSIEAFEQVLYHTTAELGLYHHIRELSYAA